MLGHLLLFGRMDHNKRIYDGNDTIGGGSIPSHLTRIPADRTGWVPEVRKSSTRKMVGACDLKWALLG